MKPVIGVTMGDPAGIGPEIILKTIGHPDIHERCRLVVFGDRALLERLEKKVLRRQVLSRVQIVDFRNVRHREFRFGGATSTSGRASGDYIEAAVRAAQTEWIDAIVTAPINKLAFRLGGWGKKYIGHTEMLAALTGTTNYALMLLYKTLRAIHVTSHIPLRRVAPELTQTRVAHTIALAHRGCVEMGIRRPRIVVCGLNPHAGEGGLLGKEEKKLIAPGVRQARMRGLDVEGPWPADVVWPMVLSKKFDVGVAMYHDQGQIPVKLLGLHAKAGGVQGAEGVNVTVGLPIIRTSVAHGTAYEIAGKGIASEKSIMDAIYLAVQMVKVRAAG